VGKKKVSYVSFGLFSGVWSLIANVSERCLFHLHRRVVTKCGSVSEICGVGIGIEQTSPSVGVGGR
jgi:hypothetical protein